MFTVTPSPLIYLQGLARTPEKRKAFFDKVRENYCVVVNVADTPCAIPDFQAEGIPAYWFPIVEFAYWGYTPFFATLRVAEMYYEKKKNILIHCHQGAHRSPIVAYTILRALGTSEEDAATQLEYPELTRILARDIKKGRIPEDIIEFLQRAINNPMMSLKDIGQIMGKTEGFYRDPDDTVKLTYDVHKLTAGL
jgi:hypothetical protein